MFSLPLFFFTPDRPSTNMPLSRAMVEGVKGVIRTTRSLKHYRNVGWYLLALLGYAVYATVATQSEYAVGYWVGVAAFFGVLLAIYRLAGRWGWFGIVIRAGCGLLALVKILTLIAHPPPH